MNKKYIQDLKFIRNELKYMINIHNTSNISLLEKYGISKFAYELKIWQFSDRSIFQKLQ